MSLAKKSIFIMLLCVSSTNNSLHFMHKTPAKKITVIFDASGDALQTGRKVDDRYERSITLQCAHDLKQLCAAAFKDRVHVVVTRTAGYTRTEFDSAQLANRLQADLFIFLSAYQQHEGPTTISLYQFSWSPHFLPQPASAIAFVPYDAAYSKSFDLSKYYGALLKQQLHAQEYQRIFTVQGTYAIPYKPLIGIQVPALGIELGLHHGADGKLLINPLAQSIIQLIQKIYEDEQDSAHN